MNILFISKLTGNMWAGLNHSVPAQVKSQSTIDNCFWYNMNHVKLDEWCTDGLDCKNIDDYPSGRLADLPEPFNKPDIAIIESVYCYTFEKIVKDLRRNSIPYVIVPRSSLTKQAQRLRRIKKQLGNIIYYNGFIKNATAIHYLSDQEKMDSIEQWGDKCFVLPNGTHSVNVTKKTFNNDKIDAVYIGRIEIYQKGLDMLVRAIDGLKNELRKSRFHLSIYGPDREGAYDELSKMIKENGLDDLVDLGNALFDQEKEKRLLEADLFIMTSRFEGMPMGLIEALSYGLPCIITTGTNMKSIIVGASAGWGAEDNADSIKEALNSMLIEKSSFLGKSKNAVQCGQKYDWSEIAKDAHKVYEKIAKKYNSSIARSSSKYR